MISKQVRLGRIFCCIVLLLYALCGTSALGQTPLGGTSEFEQILSRLANAEKITLLCEEQPFRLSLTQTERTELEQRLAQATTSAEKVKAVADAFDYQVESPNGNVFPLVKRFSDPSDLPTYSLPEVAERIRRLNVVCQRFMPVEARERPFQRLIASLNPAQWEKAGSETGIAFADLEAEQKDLLSKTLFQRGWRPLRDFVAMEERFAGLMRPNARFEYGQLDRLTLPMYCFTRRASLGEIKVSINYRIYTNLTGVSQYQDAFLPVSGPAGSAEAEVSPDPASLPDSFLKTNTPRIAKSLSDVIARVLMTTNWKASPYRVFAADSLLTDKSLVVAGLEYAEAEKLVNGLAQVCDARVVKASVQPDTVRIAVQNLPIVQNPEYVRTALRTMLPSSFHRVYQAHVTRLDKQLGPRSDTPIKDPVRWAKEEGLRRDGAWLALYLTSIRRLQNLVLPELDKREDKRYPMTQATDAERSLIVLSTLATAVPSLQGSSQKPNPLLSHVEESRAQIRKGIAPRTYSYSFFYRDPITQRQSGFGGGIAFDR